MALAMSELDPYRIQIDRLKFEYKRETRSERRLASIQRRLEILRQWLVLSQKRIKANGTGAAIESVTASAPTDHTGASNELVIDAPQPAPSVETDGQWLRMLQDCEIDEVHLPAGVTVRVPQAKVEALLASGVCTAVSESWLAERTLQVAGAAAASHIESDGDGGDHSMNAEPAPLAEHDAERPTS